MPWEPFYQLEHDGLAEGSQESEQVVSRARLPTDCEKNRFARRWICDGGSSFLGSRPTRRGRVARKPGNSLCRGRFWEGTTPVAFVVEVTP